MVEVGVGVKLGKGVGVGVGVMVGVIVAEGLAVNEGKSLDPAAKTVKERVIFRPSAKLAVTVCWPGERPLGGTQLQVPSSLIVTCEVRVSGELTVIVKLSPAGPVPKNSGIDVLTFSPSEGLIIVRLAEGGTPSSTENLEEEDDCPEVGVGWEGAFRKSKLLPKVIVGKGLSYLVTATAVAVPAGPP